MSFCVICQDIPTELFSHELPGGSRPDIFSHPSHSKEYFHQPSVRALRASAESGCPLCKLLLCHYLYPRYGVQDSNQDEDADKPVILSRYFPVPYRIHLHIGTNFPGNFWADIAFVTAPLDWCINFPMNIITDNRNTLIKSWLSHCLKNHRCNPHQEGFVPTRLLDIQPFPGCQDVRLTVTNEPGCFEYIAVSHHWDASWTKASKTTLGNLCEHVQEIRYTNLPPLLQKIIDMIRELGFRYVWIDSYCIIQDSKEGWLSEAANIDKVYGNALFTICASYPAEGPTQLDIPQIPAGRNGCPGIVELALPDEGPEDSEPSGGSSNTVGKQAILRRVRLFADEPLDWEACVRESDLSKRAWGLQERQLSPRVVHFTPKLLLWECRSLRASNQTPWTDRVEANPEYEPLHRVFDGEIDVRHRHSPDPSLPCIWHNRWYYLIWDYTNRTLTVESDKFPAIAALAHKLQSQLPNDTYVAGLWKKDLTRGLLWKPKRFPDQAHGVVVQRRPCPPDDVPGPNGPLAHRRPKSYRAPTWSWASLEGPVSFQTARIYDRDTPMWTCCGTLMNLDVKIPVPTILDVQLGSTGGDSIQSTTAGGINLKGYIKPAISISNLKDLRLSNLGSIYWVDGCRSLHDATQTSRCIGVLQYDVPSEISDREVVYCLPIQTEIQYALYDDDIPECINWGTLGEPRMLGLALVPTREGEGEFRRVGFVEFIAQSWFEDAQEAIITIV